MQNFGGQEKSIMVFLKVNFWVIGSLGGDAEPYFLGEWCEMKRNS